MVAEKTVRQRVGDVCLSDLLKVILAFSAKMLTAFRISHVLAPATASERRLPLRRRIYECSRLKAATEEYGQETELKSNLAEEDGVDYYAVLGVVRSLID